MMELSKDPISINLFDEIQHLKKEKQLLVNKLAKVHSILLQVNEYYFENPANNIHFKINEAITAIEDY